MGRATSWVPVPLTSCIPSCVWPSPKYVTLEQLKATWGTSPVPAAPAPGLPPWAPASQDLVPTTCLLPALPSSSSFASIPPSAQMEKLLLPAVDLEQWYQELMAGLGTGPGAASPRSSPPPLPAKASRQLQVTPPCRSINPTVLP